MQHPHLRLAPPSNHVLVASALPRQRIVTLAFLFPEGGDNPLLNKVVAALSEYRTCHVELVFDDDMSFSIFAGSKLFFRKRTFSNPDYHLLSFSVPHAEYASLYSFCQSASTHDLGFSDVGMYMCYLQSRQCPVFNTAPSVQAGWTFCSKIVAEALLFAGAPEAEGLIPCTTSPSCLYGAFKDSPRRVLSSVGFRQEQLRRCGVIFG